MKLKDFKRLHLCQLKRRTAGLTDHEHPAVFPQTEHLAFYTGEYGSIQIVVTDRRGRFARRISPHGGNSTQPSWHPTGKRIVYRHQHTPAHPWEIWETRLTGDKEPYRLLADPAWHYKHPSFSPDGKLMAYFSDEGSNGIFHLWLQDCETELRSQVTFGDSQNHCHPVFSPDSKRLVFHAYEGVDMSEPPVTNLFELELASGRIAPLTHGEDQYKHPFYLTGNVVTFHHEDNATGCRCLAAMHIASGEIIQLTRGKFNDKHPFPWVDRKGRMRLAYASKKRGKRLPNEASTYDIFIARLKH